MRTVTQNLVESLLLDVLPRPAAICDFGIDSPEHYAALKFGYIGEFYTDEELDEALGDGQKITALVARQGGSFGKVVFRTAYDDM